MAETKKWKILRKMWFLIFVITLSCTIKKANSEKLITKVVLYKQSTTATDADVSFDKKSFWENNFKDHTFIYQIFADNEYQNIIDKVRKMDVVAITGTEYYNSVNYVLL